MNKNNESEEDKIRRWLSDWMFDQNPERLAKAIEILSKELQIQLFRGTLQTKNDKENLG